MFVYAKVNTLNPEGMELREAENMKELRETIEKEVEEVKRNNPSGYSKQIVDGYAVFYPGYSIVWKFIWV